MCSPGVKSALSSCSLHWCKNVRGALYTSPGGHSSRGDVLQENVAKNSLATLSCDLKSLTCQELISGNHVGLSVHSFTDSIVSTDALCASITLI